MRKQIPRMSKNASTVYAFAFHATLFDVRWKSFLKKIFGMKLLFNPHSVDIRWVLITPSPKIYRPIIKLYCWLNGLAPVQMITSSNWFRTEKDSSKWTLNILLNISNGENVLKYLNPKIVRKVRYIDNNAENDSYINSTVNRMYNDVLAMTVSDFWQQTFEHVL